MCSRGGAAGFPAGRSSAWWSVRWRRQARWAAALSVGCKARGAIVLLAGGDGRAALTTLEHAGMVQPRHLEAREDHRGTTCARPRRIARCLR